MKLPVTQRIVEEVLLDAHAEGRLACGTWADARRPDDFCGCAVGNLLYAATGKNVSVSRVHEVAQKVIYSQYTGDDGAALSAALAGDYLAAISCIYETHGRDEDDLALERVIAKIREILPARFSIDIDGLLALPTWRKKKRKTKGKAKK